jgi:hypothetical protein
MYVYILLDISKLGSLEILDLSINNLQLWPLGMLSSFDKFLVLSEYV